MENVERNFKFLNDKEYELFENWFSASLINIKNDEILINDGSDKERLKIFINYINKNNSYENNVININKIFDDIETVYSKFSQNSLITTKKIILDKLKNR